MDRLEQDLIEVENEVLRDEIEALRKAAKDLLVQVENYTMKAGSRTLLLQSAERLRREVFNENA